MYQRLRAIVECQVVGRDVHGTLDPIAMHHILWRRAIEDARRDGAMVLFVPPDVIWSQSSFGHIGEVAATGKHAIFMAYMRVVSETAVPAVRRLFQDPSTGVIDAPSRALVDLGMRHIHPLTLTYCRDSPNFPIHPEFILWPVGREGYLMRVLVREMFAYDPRHFDLNPQALLAHRPDPADVHYITDSDDLFSLSLAPLAKDVEWYAKPQRLDPLNLGAWWLRYDSPANDVVAGHYFYIHREERTPRAWREAELQSDVLLERIAGMREVLRVLTAMQTANLAYAEQVLAAALIETKLARFIRPNGGAATILLPGAAATYRWLFDRDPQAPRGAMTRSLLRLLLDHVVAGYVELEPGREATLTTPLGGERRLTWRDDVPLIDGIELDRAKHILGRCWCYQVAEILPPTPIRRRARHGVTRAARASDQVPVQSAR